jgi:LPXTG-motif cell wall-anchored protein
VAGIALPGKPLSAGRPFRKNNLMNMNKFTNRIVALGALGVASVFLVTPQIASAHHITGSVNVSCNAKTVSVSVTDWTGNVEIKKTPSGPVTEKAPPSSAATSSGATVTFTIASIGGNGNYTVGRQFNPTDPIPQKFTVNCTTPTPTPTPTPTHTPTPTPTPTGSVHGITSDPTPTGGVLGISVPDTGTGVSGSDLPALGIALTFAGVALISLRRRRTELKSLPRDE